MASMGSVAHRRRFRSTGNGVGWPKAEIAGRDQDQGRNDAVCEVAEKHRENPAKRPRVQRVVRRTDLPDERGYDEANECRNLAAQSRNFKGSLAGRASEIM
jgi:hypothetical protein